MIRVISTGIDPKSLNELRSYKPRSLRIIGLRLGREKIILRDGKIKVL